MRVQNLGLPPQHFRSKLLWFVNFVTMMFLKQKTLKFDIWVSLRMSAQDLGQLKCQAKIWVS